MYPDDHSAPLAVVTGAAHRLGRAIAMELAQQGYAIGLHYYHSTEAALQTAADLQAAGAAVELIQADLTKPEQIERLFEQTDALNRPLKVLVNAAGVMSYADLRTLTVEEWDAVMALNLRAPWLCARAAALRMPAGGVIVNLVDSGIRKTWSSYPVYSISKGGLDTLTRLLAKTLGPDIRVNAVAPGLMMRADTLPEVEWQRLVDRLPLHRAGTPEDVARAVTYLVQSTYITGETIFVDGGYQLV